jgi:flagellar hook assembly protein FlgD
VQTDGGGIDPNQPEPGSEEAEAVFETAAGAPVSVEVYNVLGQRIRRMPEMTLSGSEFRWDGRDDAGRRAPGGIYFYRIRSQDAVEVRKIYLAH